MDSVISQNGLNALLASLQNSVPVSKVLSSLDKLNLNLLDKNNLYHGILEIISTTSDPKDAARSILEGVVALIQAKSSLVTEMIVESHEDSGSISNTGVIKNSPIFRRVG